MKKTREALAKGQVEIIIGQLVTAGVNHVIFVGEVEHCTHRAGAQPLLFHGGRYYTEHPL